MGILRFKDRGARGARRLRRRKLLAAAAVMLPLALAGGGLKALPVHADAGTAALQAYSDANNLLATGSATDVVNTFLFAQQYSSQCTDSVLAGGLVTDDCVYWTAVDEFLLPYVEIILASGQG